MLIYCNSNQRKTGIPANFTLEFNQELFNFDEPLKLELVQAIIPYTFGQLSTNDYFNLVIDGITTKITFGTSGWYSIKSICSIVKAKLDFHTSPKVWTITFNEITNKINFSVNGYTTQNNISLNFSGTSGRIMFPILGFIKNSSHTMVWDGAKHSLVSVVPVEMQDPYIDIVLNANIGQDGYNIAYDGTNHYYSNIFSRIPIQQTSNGSPILWQNIGDTNSKIILHYINQFHIMLYDSHGQILNLSNDWSFIIKLTPALNPELKTFKMLNNIHKQIEELKDIILLKKSKE